MQFAAISLILTTISLVAGMSSTDGIGSAIKHLRASAPKVEAPVLTSAVHLMPKKVAKEKVWLSSSSISSNTVCQHYESDPRRETDPRAYYTDM